MTCSSNAPWKKSQALALSLHHTPKPFSRHRSFQHTALLFTQKFVTSLPDTSGCWYQFAATVTASKQSPTTSLASAFIRTWCSLDVPTRPLRKQNQEMEEQDICNQPERFRSQSCAVSCRSADFSPRSTRLAA